VNVDDVDDDVIPTPTRELDRLDLIYDRQAELALKYHDIEAKNDLLQFATMPIDIHDRFGQARLKDFAWRITEELAEATQALKDHEHIRTHFLEELSDAYHFLIELNLLSSLAPEAIYSYLTAEHKYYSDKHCKLEILFDLVFINQGIYSLSESAYNVIQGLGNAMNCLKNKPWKTTHILTDEGEYRRNLIRANEAFIALAIASGLDADGLFKIYFKKSEVNKFRQRSNY